MKKSASLIFKSAIIFILFFSLFLSGHLLNREGFTSPDDPYSHAKYSLLIAQTGELNLVRPWMEMQFYNYAPTDLWWGFHLGEALFIRLFGLFLGVKIFISLLAGLVFLFFYIILNKLKLKYPLVWTLLLFFSSISFAYRLFLERPHLLSMIFLPSAFLLLAKKRNVWLFILSLIYALCYDLAPLIIFLTLIYLAADYYITRKINLRPLIAASGGILAGIIIHPYSLNYLYGIFTQFCLVLFYRFSGINLGIGGEVQLSGFFDFIQSNFLVILFNILAAVLFLSLKKANKSATTLKVPDENSSIRVFLFLYSSFWLIMTLLVPRGVEFWLPAVFLFSAVMFSDFIKSEEFAQIKQGLVKKINLKVLKFFLISALFLIAFNNLSEMFNGLHYNKDISELSENYYQANAWLKANTKKDEIVFYDNWGMFPMMFFYNDYNRYILGLDPTSTYEFDQKTYWLWRNISLDGLYCDQPDPCLNLSSREQIKLVPMAIKVIFQSKYAVVRNFKESSLIKTFNNLKSQVKLVFKNKDLLIYEML